MKSRIHSFAKYFFPAKFYFRILKKENLTGKNLLGKRVNLLCIEGFSLEKLQKINFFTQNFQFLKWWENYLYIKNQSRFKPKFYYVHFPFSAFSYCVWRLFYCGGASRRPWLKLCKKTHKFKRKYSILGLKFRVVEYSNARIGNPNFIWNFSN